MASLRAILRGLANAIPEVRLLLVIQDCICYIITSTIDLVISIVTSTFKIIYKFVEKLCSALIKCQKLIPFVGSRRPVDYKRIKRKKNYKEPIPYENNLFKRFLTYYGGIFLGILLYLFVYYVLIKHHTYTSVSVAFLLLMAYLIILENSHNIRSILMLCLPIMFTNRGRALIFCCMLTIMMNGPWTTSQLNLSQLQMSIHCCKQYLIIKTDKVVEENVVQNIVRVEEIVHKLLDDIKEFAEEIKERARVLVKLAITVETFIEESVRKLVEIVNICNVHTHEVYDNCIKTFDYAYQDCEEKLGYGLDILCKIVKPLPGLCPLVRVPNFLCSIPKELVKFIDSTIGERLRYYMIVIENEFYVDVEIDHYYSYNGTESKTYDEVIAGIRHDIDKKLWFFKLFIRVFNLVSLILVVWIIITATLYHMHYLDDIKYDNMYLDDYLEEIDKRRKLKNTNSSAHKPSNPSSDWRLYDMDDETLLMNENSSPEASVIDDEPLSQLANEDAYLFPMTKLHIKKYFQPFSIWMNDFEKDKLCIASLVWSVIIGYIFFFVFVDFALYQLIELVDNILNSILFTSDLPLVDVTSKTGDEPIKYNRTYLNQLRNRAQQEWLTKKMNSSYRLGSLGAMYRRLMNSIEEKIPDDVAILDSLQKCLPKAVEPNYGNYKNLLYLSLLTFLGVIVEAYALRTRHCIANLYYPLRARKRAAWFYQKLVAEKPKFYGSESVEDGKKSKLLQLGLKVLAKR